MFQLCSALAAHGIPWHTRIYRGFSVLQYPAIADMHETVCGACMACLRASGVAERMRHKVRNYWVDSSDDDSSEDNSSDDG